jgi:hypothetical protein
MMSKPLALTLTLALLLLAPGCSDDSGVTDGGRDGGGDGGSAEGPPPAKKLTWITDTLDDNSAGTHAQIASGGGKLGVAYFRSLEDMVVVTCPATYGQPGGKKPRPGQDLYYIGHDGSDWGKPVKVDQTIGSTYGLSLTLDRKTGKALIGYLGGAMSKQECASSDALLASSADGKQWTKTNLDAAGAVGDTVGQWMSVAWDSKGSPHASYRDVRFGVYETDGEIKASLLYDATVVLADNGDGWYTSLVMDATDRPVIVHYNPNHSDVQGGIQVAYNRGTAWATAQLVSGSTAQAPSLATDNKGNFGVAYYDPDKQALFLQTAGGGDLDRWSGSQVDRTLTNNGQFASLAYDSYGRPAVAYYRCGKYGQKTCDLNRDAVMFARLVQGKWEIHEVDTGDNQRCGTYASLAFAADGDPVVVYKCTAYDNLASAWVETLKVARGVVK